MNFRFSQKKLAFEVCLRHFGNQKFSKGFVGLNNLKKKLFLIVLRFFLSFFYIFFTKIVFQFAYSIMTVNYA